MSMTYEDYTTEMLEWAKEDIEYMIDELILHYDGFDDMFYNWLLQTDIVAPYDDYWFTEEEAAENIRDLVDDSHVWNMCYYHLGFREGTPKDENPRYIDAVIRECALRDVMWELEQYYDQLVEECEDLRAMRHLMDNAHVSEDTAQYLIEWWADDKNHPMPWVEKYAPYIRELHADDPTPEIWEKHHPYDLVIEDEGFHAPAVVICEDIVNYY